MHGLHFITLSLFGRKIHYPPETTSITLIVKLLGMYIQAEEKTEFLAKLKDFQNKVVNEDLMISHKMLGPNFETQLQQLYPAYCRAFAGNDTTMVNTFSAFNIIENILTFFVCASGKFRFYIVL